ncbi:MAG: hypothetical protein HY298_20835 [Verrucomicrobia bacterium]|nr:hypothetical protein [Verrucomicrobiota bacterium]
MDIHKLIAAINPKLYCAARRRRETATHLRDAPLKRDHFAYVKAAAVAQSVEPNGVSLERLEEINPFRLAGFQSPVEQHTLVYENLGDSIEALYFSLLDEITSHETWQVTKLTDSFITSPGSGMFADLARRQIQMQQEAMKTLSAAQQRAQHILHLISELRIDRESLQTGQGTSQPDPVLEQRKLIDRRLLRSQVDALKLQVRWLKPYLKAARQLGSTAKPTAALVTVFNSALFELTLLAEAEYHVDEAVDRGDLPALFKKSKLRAPRPVIVIELSVRAVPERIGSGSYGFRGRTHIRFTSYALNQQEITVLRRELDRGELQETFDVLSPEPMADLDIIVNEIESLIEEPKTKDTSAPPDDPNPFSALFSLHELFAPKTAVPNSTQDEFVPIRPDSDLEEVLRSEAILEARRHCQKFYETMKRRHHMACV